MDRLQGSSLRNIARFAPHTTRLMCMSQAFKSKLRCKCSDRVLATTALALTARGLQAMTAAVCFGDRFMVHHLLFCFPCPQVFLEAPSPGPFCEFVRATPLGHAVLEGASDILRMLLAGRADPDSKISNNMQIVCTDWTVMEGLRDKSVTYMTPLMAAIQTDTHSGGVELTRALVEAKAAVNGWCWESWEVDDKIRRRLTPLISALGSEDLISLLLKSSAEVTGTHYQYWDFLDAQGPATTLLQYLHEKQWKNFEVDRTPHLNLCTSLHRPPARRARMILLREHGFNAKFAIDGSVVIQPDELVLVQASRAAGLSEEKDDMRRKACGSRAAVLEVDFSDATVKLKIAESINASVSDSASDSDSSEAIWFPMAAVVGEDGSPERSLSESREAESRPYPPGLHKTFRDWLMLKGGSSSDSSNASRANNRQAGGRGYPL